VAGRRPVEEVFAAGRVARRLLVVPQRRNALEQLVLHATRLRIPIVEVEGGSLTAIAGFDGHQGVALVVEPRHFASIGDVLARAEERAEAPFVLVLDSLEDPQNFGTLLRSAEAAGVHGVIFPTRRQAPLSPAAVKASAGATEHLLLCPVDDLPGALADLHARGLRIAGSEADARLTARQTDLRGPLAIIVGSEGQGLGPAVRRRCDLFMRIPMQGRIGSLNAAVAGSVLLFEAVAQRDPAGVRSAAAGTPAPAEPARRAAAPADPADPAEPGAQTDPADPATAADRRETPDPTAAASGPPRPDGESDLLPGGPPPDPAPATVARKPRTSRA
jgi:23S rRNA (guanosine2251-2'-O)-methyltransferase